MDSRKSHLTHGSKDVRHLRKRHRGKQTNDQCETKR